MATNIPHWLTMPTLSSLPGNSFRVKKVVHYATDRSPASAGNTRRINITAPPNYYLLGNHSTVEFTYKGKAGNKNPDAPANGAAASANVSSPEFNPSRRYRVRWGAGYPFSRIRETVNSGSFCVESLTDPDSVGPIFSRRGWCTHRDAYLTDQQMSTIYSLAAGPAAPGIAAGAQYFFKNINEVTTGTINIAGLENAGYASDEVRSRIMPSVTASAANDDRGIAYSVPMTAYSRLAQCEFLPVGLIGSFATEALCLEFTVQADGFAVSDPTGDQTGTVDNGFEMFNIRANCTYIEILDADVQEAIEKLYKKDEKLMISPGVDVPLRLELPFINYSYSSHILPNGSRNTILRVNSNSPSVRGFMVVDGRAGSLGIASQGDLSNSIARWTSMKVVIGGHCVMECPYETIDNASAPQIFSDLWTEYMNGSHLFSLYAPHREALAPATPLGITKYNVLNKAKPNFICVSFENSPHFNLTESELVSARGVDMRNVGQMEIHLKYEDAAQAPGNGNPITAAQNIYVVLAHDQVISVDRSGCHDITNSSL